MSGDDFYILSNLREALRSLRRPAGIAAITNMVLILLIPIGMIVAASIHGTPGNTVVAYTSSGTRRLFVSLFDAALVVMPFSSLALLAACRTWVHAQRYLEGRGTGWQGVAEAGMTGLGVALMVLGPGIATHPRDAPPYVLFYGGAAFILGLALGLVLRTAAILVLKRQGAQAKA